MEDGSKKVSRRELYEQVWAVPMARLAKEYGLSDSGLAKICRKHNIPRPPRGFWARVAAGQILKRAPLPTGDPGIVIEIASYIHQGQEFSFQKTDPHILTGPPAESPVIVSKKLGRAHLLVKQSTEILKNCKPDATGILKTPGKGCLDINVSRKSLSRALRIMEALIKALEKRGGSVSISGESTLVAILDIRLGFGISEQLVRKKIEARDHDLDSYYRFGHSRFDEQRIPSGILCLTLNDPDFYWDSHYRKNWRGSEKRPLENSLDSFMKGLLNLAVHKRERIRQKEEEKRQQLERQRIRQEEERLRAEKRRQIKEEQERLSSLVSAAEAWEKSILVRDFINAVEAAARAGYYPIEPKEKLENWLKWAREQADRLDPVTPSPPSILDEADKITEDSPASFKRPCSYR
jgi:hypothetical protein